MAVDGPPQGPLVDPPATSAPITNEPSGGRHIGEWSIQRELGRGGMGAVYLAEHDVTHEKVAMKELLITSAADPVAVRRFLQEGEVMQRLGHPNIVAVRDIIEAGGGHYIALEFVAGGSLRDLLRGRPLPTPQAFAVMHGLLQALDHAHQNAIVHRDVKPENVMLSLKGEVKVADFGIARLTDDSATSNATKTGTTVGTPQYMSPEQVTTSKVDGRSDLYSAGIVCYEVFCGRPPFEATEADGPFTLFAKHVQAPPPPPTVIRPGLDPALETVILKSLSKRPEDRYQTGAEFDRELTRIANRLCGPDWIHSLEPGADLSRMVPQAPGTMGSMQVAAAAAGPAAMTAAAAGATAQPTLPTAAPVYAPKPPAHHRDKVGPAASSNLVLIGGVVAALLVVAGVVVFFLFENRPANTGAVTPTANSTAAQSGPCAFLTAGVTPAAGSGGACGLKLGTQVEADSLAGLSALPPDLHGSAFDANGIPTKAAAIAVSGGFATLNAPSRGAGLGVVTGATPTDEVVIADFTPTSSADANLGVAARCSPTDCLFLYVSPVGKVWIAERVAGAVPVSKFNDTAQVQLNQLNRLVLSVKGSQAEAWLNGNLVSSVQVDVANPGAATFYALNESGAATTVNLSDLYVFTPGS
ncbi:MAG TPA: serine/threonine-protein kinase [Candidatus Dormibacteraeota bacterium]|nr:serine/threonine-protein kinase [Candidatus Dormibacteraeota bacterium]